MNINNNNDDHDDDDESGTLWGGAGINYKKNWSCRDRVIKKGFSRGSGIGARVFTFLFLAGIVYLIYIALFNVK